MLNIEEFLKIAISPRDAEAEWLEGAAKAVNYAVMNSKSSDIILYTAVGQTYFHSVLARLDKVTPRIPTICFTPMRVRTRRGRSGTVSVGASPTGFICQPPLTALGATRASAESSLCFAVALGESTKAWFERSYPNASCRRSTSTGLTRKAPIAA
jgi:hypothetical protein